MKGFRKRGFVLVGLYHVDRCYGGPEEGGGASMHGSMWYRGFSRAPMAEHKGRAAGGIPR